MYIQIELNEEQTRQFRLKAIDKGMSAKSLLKEIALKEIQ